MYKQKMSEEFHECNDRRLELVKKKYTLFDGLDYNEEKELQHLEMEVSVMLEKILPFQGK